MDSGKKRFKIKKRFIALLALIFFLIGGTSVRLFTDSTNAVAATSIIDTLSMMGENNPINLALSKKTKEIEEEKIRTEIKAAEEKRIGEEKEKLDEEKRMAEEKAKLDEEKRIEKEKVKAGKIAYLTFDDGPSAKITPAILDILGDYNIKATFFVIGKMVDANPKIIKRIYNEGHSIGNHTYSHKYNYIYKNTNNLLNELKLTERSLKDILGEAFQTRLLRLPGGSFERHKDKYVDAAVEEGYRNYDWNALNGDAEGADLSKERLINRLKSTTKKQKELIILMHDTDTKKATVESLPAIIDYLIKEGYVFKALDQ